MLKHDDYESRRSVVTLIPGPSITAPVTIVAVIIIRVLQCHKAVSSWI